MPPVAPPRQRRAAPDPAASSTASAAARSSSANPTDLNTVISSARVRPGCRPHTRSASDAATSLRADRAFGDRLHDVAAFGHRAFARVDDDEIGARHRGGVGLAHRLDECADEIEMHARVQPFAPDQRRRRERRARDDVRAAHRRLEIATAATGNPARAIAAAAASACAGVRLHRLIRADSAQRAIGFGQRVRHPPRAGDHQVRRVGARKVTAPRAPTRRRYGAR